MTPAEEKAATDASIAADDSAMKTIAYATLARIHATERESVPLNLQRALAAEAEAMAESDRLAAQLSPAGIAKRIEAARARVDAQRENYYRPVPPGRGLVSQAEVNKWYWEAAQKILDRATGKSNFSALALFARKVGPLPMWGWAAAGLGAFLLLRRR